MHGKKSLYECWFEDGDALVFGNLTWTTNEERTKTMKTYKTTGTCSSAINYEVADGVVTKCEFVGGCPGNTQGVAKLVIGRKVEDVIAMLKGIQCRNGTSCPDQLARALESELPIAQGSAR